MKNSDNTRQNFLNGKGDTLSTILYASAKLWRLAVRLLTRVDRTKPCKTLTNAEEEYTQLLSLSRPKFALFTITAALCESVPRLLGIVKVLNGSNYCGQAADCWSVGVTLFTMLAGFSPFSDDEAEVRQSRRGKQIGTIELA